jgi:hypothetical protein
MSPSHANKKGVRYRYYVSQALLQNRKSEAGSVPRVAATDVERLVANAVREAIAAAICDDQKIMPTSEIADHDRILPGASETSSDKTDPVDHDLIRRHVARVVVHPGRIEVAFKTSEDALDEVVGFSPEAKSVEEAISARPAGPDGNAGLRDEVDAEDKAGPARSQSDGAVVALKMKIIPLRAKRPMRKGLAPVPPGAGDDRAPCSRRAPSGDRPLAPLDRGILKGEAASFEAIASAEGLAERHVRFLIPLAYLSPRVVAAIADGSIRQNLTTSSLARALPHKWSGQEQMLGIG